MKTPRVVRAVQKSGDVYDVYYSDCGAFDRDVSWAYVREAAEGYDRIEVDRTYSRGACEARFETVWLTEEDPDEEELARRSRVVHGTECPKCGGRDIDANLHGDAFLCCDCGAPWDTDYDHWS